MKLAKSSQVLTLKGQLANALNKLNDTQSSLECQRLLQQNLDQLHMIVNVMCDFTGVARTHREHIKLFGALANFARQDLLDHLPQIMTVFIKRLSECNAQLMPLISDTVGVVIQATFEKVDLKVALKHLQLVLKPLYVHLQSYPQHSLTLTRIIQSLPVPVLENQAANFINMVVNLLQNNKGKVELLEAILALMLSIEGKVAQYTQTILSLLYPLTSNCDWQVRKMSLDVLYTMAVLCPVSLKQDKRSRDAIQSMTRDKIKKVREAALLVDGILKDIKDQKDQKDEKSQKAEENSYINEHKMEVTIQVLEQLMNLLTQKGLLECMEVKPLLQQLSTIKQNNHFTVDRSSMIFSDEDETPKMPLQQTNRTDFTPRSTFRAEQQQSTVSPLKENPISPCLTPSLKSSPKQTQILEEINFKELPQTFISKEAAAILEEFRQKRQF